MTMLELTPEELGVLTDILEHAVSDLSIETYHTDNKDFKEMLKHRKRILDSLLERMRQTSVPA